jgi:DNA-binding CsgD family transcriptional regulator
MIAKEVGCSREFVRQVRKEKKIESPMKNQPCRPNDEEYVRIILRRMKELVPKSLIAKELGTTITTLLNICNRYGIKTPEGYPITLTMRHAMLLYKAKPDITQSEIARILGVEPPVITRAFRFLEKEHIEWQPFQSQGRSMFDEYMDAIEVLMKKKVPITKISQLLGVNYNSLYVHLKKIRKKKEEI